MDMTTFIIRTEDEEDLGFILFAKHSGEWPPPGEIDCVFTGSPHAAALRDDPRGRFVAEHKGREWTADVSYTETQMTVRMALSTEWTFAIVSDESGNRWQATRKSEQLQGRGVFL